MTDRRTFLAMLGGAVLTPAVAKFVPAIEVQPALYPWQDSAIVRIMNERAAEKLVRPPLLYVTQNIFDAAMAKGITHFGAHKVTLIPEIDELEAGDG